MAGDIFWGLIKFGITMSWFVGAGVISIFIYKIPFVRKWFEEIQKDNG